LYGFFAGAAKAANATTSASARETIFFIPMPPISVLSITPVAA
jgi:hypothetical protein